MSLPVEATELDGGAADVDADQLRTNALSRGRGNGGQDGEGERWPGTSAATRKPETKARCPGADMDRANTKTAAATNRFGPANHGDPINDAA
jgi:hypothetical protein